VDPRLQQLAILAQAMGRAPVPTQGLPMATNPNVPSIPGTLDPGGVPFPVSPHSWTGRDRLAEAGWIGKQGAGGAGSYPQGAVPPGGPYVPATDLAAAFGRQRPMAKRSLARGHGDTLKRNSRTYGADIARGA